MGKSEDTVTQATPLPKAEAPPSRSLLKADQMVDGRYAVKRFIARGGNCEVYEVEDNLVRERVALKILRPRAARGDDADERFRREIQLARKVTHVNVCRLYDAGVHEGVPFFTMELLTGETLAQRLGREGRMKTGDAVPIVKQVCAGMAAAHKAGVVHRDLKSSNVMLVQAPDDEAGLRVVITDFGVARAFGVDLGEFATGTGMIVGTPAYMAPEQIEGREITPAADIYALGVVLYEMVTGQLPFAAGTPLATAELRLKQAPASPRAHVPDLDTGWETTILRCLGRHPSARFGSITEVPEALELIDDAPTLVATESLPDSLPIPELPPPEYPPEPAPEPDPTPVTATPAPPPSETSDSEVLLPTTPHPKILVPDLVPFPEQTFLAYTAAAVAILIAGWLILRPQPTSWDGHYTPIALASPAPVTSARAPAPIPAPEPEPEPAPAPAPAPASAPAPAPPPKLATRAPGPVPVPRSHPLAPRPAAPPPASPPAPTPVATSPEYDAFIADAKAAYASKNYVKAIYRAEYALQRKPADPEALAIAGMAACRMKNPDIAAKYMRQLRGQRLNLVRQVCLVNKVALRD